MKNWDLKVIVIGLAMAFTAMPVFAMLYCFFTNNWEGGVIATIGSVAGIFLVRLTIDGFRANGPRGTSSGEQRHLPERLRNMQ